MADFCNAGQKLRGLGVSTQGLLQTQQVLAHFAFEVAVIHLDQTIYFFHVIVDEFIDLLVLRAHSFAPDDALVYTKLASEKFNVKVKGVMQSSDRPPELPNHEEPLVLLGRWMDEARKTSLRDPNAFVLSTISADNAPSARVLLCKEITAEGFLFYTNYDSAKGHDLAKNPHCSATFFWDPLHRQVRLRGRADRVAAEKSDAYWKTRARASQLSQLASKQSQVLESRASMQERVSALDEKYTGQQVPRPENWGGYLFKPSLIEFWMGRSGRFHDRVLFTKADNAWSESRLYP